MIHNKWTTTKINRTQATYYGLRLDPVILEHSHSICDSVPTMALVKTLRPIHIKEQCHELRALVIWGFTLSHLAHKHPYHFATHCRFGVTSWYMQAHRLVKFLPFCSSKTIRIITIDSRRIHLKVGDMLTLTKSPMPYLCIPDSLLSTTPFYKPPYRQFINNKRVHQALTLLVCRQTHTAARRRAVQ